MGEPNQPQAAFGELRQSRRRAKALRSGSKFVRSETEVRGEDDLCAVDWSGSRSEALLLFLFAFAGRPRSQQGRPVRSDRSMQAGRARWRAALANAWLRSRILALPPRKLASPGRYGCFRDRRHNPAPDLR